MSAPISSQALLLPRSARPAKQLLWLWLAEDMSASGNFKNGLDLGCGDMALRRLFKTESYVGVDCDASRLSLAAAQYSDVTATVGAIEETELTGDFVLCVQTIGFNRLFDAANTFKAVEKLIECVRPGGMLVLNIGRPSQQYRQEIDARLHASFDNVRKRDYGANNSERSHRVSMLCARMMKLVPMLRGHGLTYFVCTGRVNKRAG